MSTAVGLLPLVSRPLLADPERKHARRRRSRSSESRKARKENPKEISFPGKKRKMGPTEDRPKSPAPSDSASTSTRPLWKFKGNRGRSETRKEAESREGSLARRLSRSKLPPSAPTTPSFADVKFESRKARPPPLIITNHPDPVVQRSAISLEIVNLRNQVLQLQKDLEDSRKSAMLKQKIIDDLQRDLAASKKKGKKQSLQIERFKASSKKADEMVASMQGNLQCQICLEVLMKPYGLSPCGHVLCLGCLQEWFRSAPAQEDEIDDDGPIEPLFRRKFCPCCRTRVFRRPIPIFLIKSIATSLIPHCPELAPVTQEVDTNADADPWGDIFPEEADNSDDEYQDAEEGEFDPERWSVDIGYTGSDIDSDSGPLYGGDSGGEPYDGEYVRPDWSPPFLAIERDDVTAEELQLLSRGATLDMIRRYNMEFDDRFGIVATTEDGRDIYLGWNIELEAVDRDGGDFMAWIEDDIVARPERWELQENGDGEWEEAHRLVRDDDGSSQGEFWED